MMTGTITGDTIGADTMGITDMIGIVDAIGDITSGTGGIGATITITTIIANGCTELGRSRKCSEVGYPSAAEYCN
jgi:hypothetical protein